MERLLLTFYEKHAPENLKNIKKIVQFYDKKPDELWNKLSKKYGEASVLIINPTW